ncbi:hypothetical protein ERJ75_001279100 [Trypanosoma vivax]|nr:hypothetical protein ERJ75_001279100 [Trypanosoma vivax]
MYDGMVHRVVPNGPEPKTVVLLIYRRRLMRTLTWMVWSAAWASTTRTRSVPGRCGCGGGPQARTEAAARRARTGNAAGNAQRQAWQKSVWQQAKENRGTPNATGSDMDEEDGETSMVELLRLVGEHLAQTHDGDETASLPHDPPASAENEEAAPQSEAGAEVDASTPNGDETASLPHDPPASAENEEAAPQSVAEVAHRGDETASLPHDPPASAENEEAAPQSVAMAEVRAMETGVQEAASETQDAVAETGSWSHVDQRLMPAVVRCPVANCDAEFEGFRRSEGIKSHMNGRHTEADRRSLTNEAMIPQGLVRCEVCGHVHGASVRARRAHVSACGDYVPRKAAMARARDNYRHETETSSAMQAAVQPEQEPVRTLPRAMREVCVGQGGENDPTTDPWMQERVGRNGTFTRRSGRRGWRCAGRRSSATARPARRSDAADSLSSWTLFARTLRWGAARRSAGVTQWPARRRGQRAHATEFRRTRERRTRSAGRGCAGTPHRRAGGDALHAERGGACGTDVDARR